VAYSRCSLATVVFALLWLQGQDLPLHPRSPLEGKARCTYGRGLALCVNCKDLSLTFLSQINFVRLAVWKQFYLSHLVRTLKYKETPSRGPSSGQTHSPVSYSCEGKRWLLKKGCLAFLGLLWFVWVLIQGQFLAVFSLILTLGSFF